MSIAFLKRLHVAVLIFLVGPSLALAQTGIELTTTIDDLAPPQRWLAMLPGQDRYVADKKNSWGKIQTSPGSYDLLVIPSGSNGRPVSFGRVTVSDGQMTRVVIDSGIRLTADEDLPPLSAWTVAPKNGGQPIAQVVNRWGFIPVPPGSYILETNTPHEAVTEQILVKPGMVTELNISALGIGYAEVKTSRDRACLLFGGNAIEARRIFPDDKYFPVERYDNNGFWARKGDVKIRWSSGSFIESQIKRIQPGKRTIFPFDLADIAAARGYSFLPPVPTLDVERLTVTDRLGNRLMLSEPNPDLNCTFIAPGGAVFRIRTRGRDRILSGVSHGSDAETDDNKTITLVIETPSADSVYDPGASSVEIIGQASAESSAGTTRIAIAIDTSASTRDSAGIDLDGDTTPESIFEAESEAVHRLIDELIRVENTTPGTAFSVSLVEFGRTASIVAPFAPMTDAKGVQRLKRTLDSITVGAQFSDTYYDRALDAASRALDNDPGTGPRIILLVTDGEPSDVIPALDAAARAGNTGTVIHAIGLGKDFSRAATGTVSYPPVPEDGASILSTISSIAGPEGKIWQLPNPGDIVNIVAELPVLKRENARVSKVMVRNLSLSGEAQEATLFPDGAFRTSLPVDFVGSPDGPMNRLEVTAVGPDPSLVASQVVRIVSTGTDPALLAEAEAARSELLAEIERLKSAYGDLEQQLSNAKSESGAAADLRIELSSMRNRLSDERANARQCRKNTSKCEADLLAILDDVAPKTPRSDGRVSRKLPNAVLFSVDSADLQDGAIPILNAVALSLRADLASDVVIEGHADSTGDADYNLRLSERRAAAVRDWLVRSGEIDADRVTVVGLGESTPLKPETKPDGSDDPEARQANRRVEILTTK